MGGKINTFFALKMQFEQIYVQKKPKLPARAPCGAVFSLILASLIFFP